MTSTDTLSFARTAAALLLLASLSGCELFKKNEEAQSVVSRRAVGLQIGDFLDQFGRPRTRTELVDGSTSYAWESTVEGARAGPDSLDQRVCKLRLITDRKGKITSAEVVYDALGRRSTSRCTEIFAPA